MKGQRGCSKCLFVEEERSGGGGWGGRGGDLLKSEQKRRGTRGGGVPSMCVRSFFYKKNAEVFKMKFYIYSPVFPIDYNGSMKY